MRPKIKSYMGEDYCVSKNIGIEQNVLVHASLYSQYIP